MAAGREANAGMSGKAKAPAERNVGRILISPSLKRADLVRRPIYRLA